MSQAAVFKSNRSQAVRIPKALEFPENVKRVDVIVDGNKRIMVPAGQSWDIWFDGATVTSDFMADREQPAEQERDEF